MRDGLHASGIFVVVDERVILDGVSCEIAPGGLTLLRAALEAHLDWGMVSGRAAVIDEHGALRESVSTLRTGRFAGEFRERFRFLPEERRIADMHQILAQTYPDVTLDTFAVSGLNRVGDSISSVVASTARNTS